MTSAALPGSPLPALLAPWAAGLPVCAATPVPLAWGGRDRGPAASQTFASGCLLGLRHEAAHPAAPLLTPPPLTLASGEGGSAASASMRGGSTAAAAAAAAAAALGPWQWCPIITACT